MFGFGKSRNPQVVGAKQKMTRARQIQFGPGGQEVVSKREGGGENLMIPVGIVYALACLLAMVLTEGALMKGAGIHFFSSNPKWDTIFFGPGIPQVYGEGDVNRLVVIMLRGTGIFAVAGILPFLSRVWNSLRDAAKVNLYVSFWGTTIAAPLIYIIVKDFLWPLLLSMAGMS